MLTRGGICYDLSITPYIQDVKYGDNVITYCFSSKLYKDTFNDRLFMNRSKINKSLSNRFKLNISFDLMNDIYLYSNIEKRGFYLIQKDVIFTCINNLKLDGNNRIVKN